MIVIQDNLLNKNECEELMLMYSTHSDKSIEWYGSHPLKLNNLVPKDDAIIEGFTTLMPLYASHN